MMKKLLTMMLLASAVGTFAAGSRNLFSNPGFESWNDQLNLPDGVAWHWEFPKGDANFTVFERTDKDKHSGNYSLRIKDDVTSNSNQCLFYPIPSSVLNNSGGKLLRFSAWCKQLSASRPKIVGIGIFYRPKDDSNKSLYQSIDATGETDWQQLEVKMIIPQETAFLKLVFHCASGWRNTAEALFDDVSVTITDVNDNGQPPKEAAPKPEPKVEPPKPIQRVQQLRMGDTFSLLPLPNSWRVHCWGGFRIKHQSGTNFATIEVPNETTPYAGFTVSTEYLNRGFDITHIPPQEASIGFTLNQDLSLVVNVCGKRVSFNNGVKIADDKWRYEAPLTDFKVPTWDAFTGIGIQFPKKLTARKFILSECGMRFSGKFPMPKINRMPAQLKEFVDSYAKEETWTDDGNVRPEIRKGTFYRNGKAEFYLGPWIYNRLSTDWGPHSNPLKIDHIAYNVPPSKELFDAMGFNSAQISAAWTMPCQAACDIPVPVELKKKEDEISRFFQGFKGSELVMDFAFGPAGGIQRDDPVLYKELEQRNTYWHEFIPLCPEHPQGKRYYDEYMKGGVKTALRNNGNVFVYELFNESSYFCSCVYNRIDFSKRMAKKYGTIAAANKRWNTIFDSFEELARQSDFHQYPAVWVDWCKFSADRYAEILKEKSALIRTIDKRPNTYFTEQLAGGTLYTEVGAGMDYRKIAEALDIVTMEGGVPFGKAEALGPRNEMENVVFSRSGDIWFYSAFFEAIAKDRKPILNNEHYCKRSEHGMRAPSKREDMITAMWGELFHGISGSFSYAWDKRSWEWKTFEQAKQNVLLPSYKGASFLNPYSWPPEQLDAFQRFRDELAPFQEQLMPMPRRRPATVALFFSYPTLRMLSYHRFDYRKRMAGWLSAMLENHFPTQIVFEEELAAGLPKHIQALIIPSAVYATPETIRDIQKFRQRGGLVIAGTDSFSFDEYGTKTPGVLSDIPRFNPDSSKIYPQIIATLKKAGVKQHGTIRPLDNLPLTSTRFDMVDRGSFKMIHTAAMDDLDPRLVHMTVNLADGDKDEYYLYDIVNRRRLDHNGKARWNAKALAKGFKMLLPPQERVLLSLEKAPRQGMTPMDIAQMDAEYRKAMEANAPRMKAYRETEARRQQEYIDNRLYRDVKVAKCHPVDISKHVNMDFKDEVSGDKKGGWFDQGANDFSTMPLGKQTLAGVPFQIIDPAKNNHKGAMVLFGTDRTYFPKAINDIKVGRKCGRLYFLHTCGWETKDGVAVMIYRIKYADGTTVDVPARHGFEVQGWWGSPVLPNAKVALEHFNVLTSKINLQCFAWNNPKPQVAITAIDVLSGQVAAVPAIVAITAEEP